EMFDHRLYRRMREKLGAVGAFPEVWDKVRLQPELRTARVRADKRELPTEPPSSRATLPDA
ncbi:MAG: hypothetical protein HKP46_05520, partial [Myxococcales bacterium]|nr:hypothetical protein [Myxococcales bacterium]